MQLEKVDLAQYTAKQCDDLLPASLVTGRIEAAQTLNW